jgi:hypothetical protein
MIRGIFTPNRETRALGQRMHAEKAPLSEAERVHLRLFVARLGNGIADDTSLFSGRERNRLLFLRWLDRHGKLYL